MKTNKTNYPRYFTHVREFSDRSLYIVFYTENTRSLVTEDGAHNCDFWALKECEENVKEGIWKEMDGCEVALKF